MRGSVGAPRGSTAAERKLPGRWRTKAKVGIALSSVLVLAAAAGLGIARNSASASVSHVVGSGFTITPGDLSFILKQIKIAEHHAATATPANPCGTLVGPGPTSVPHGFAGVKVAA